MDSTAHLQILQAYYSKHGNLPSLSALPYIFETTNQTAEQVVLNLRKEQKVGLAPDGSLIPGKDFLANFQETAPFSMESIPAGIPASISNNTMQSLNIHAYLVNAPGKTIVIPIAGDSMKDAGIEDGDLGIIELNNCPNVGDIVAAEIDGNFTLKRLAIDSLGNHFLHPENANYQDMRPRESLKIHGTLVGLARKY